MSNFALAYDFSSRQHRPAASRPRLAIVTVPWHDVGVEKTSPAAQASGLTIAGLAIAVLAVIVAHVALVRFVINQHAATRVLQTKHEVSVELVAPPKPPPPRVEPPKPLPPKPVARRQALPPIQAAVPDAPTVASSATEAPVAVAPVAEPPPPAEPEPITAAFGRAGYLNNPPPRYPSLAARNGWQGTVMLRVRVLSSGQVDVVEVQKSSGFKLLDEEAKATVHSWMFTPSKRGATPIDGWATVPIEFKLDS